jgi:hypothetical protein
MSDAVFKEYYEVTGKSKKAAQAFAAERAAALEAQWAIVKSFGADGFRPGHGGGIKSLMFEPDTGKKIPEGLRRIGRAEQGRIEFEPVRNTKAGKAVVAKLAEAPVVKDWGKFADTFGWKGRMPMGPSAGSRTGMAIYSCQGIRVVLPRERIIVIYPRQLKDGWKPEAYPDLKPIRESDMLRAIEKHNDLLKEKK